MTPNPWRKPILRNSHYNEVNENDVSFMYCTTFCCRKRLFHSKALLQRTLSAKAGNKVGELSN